MSAKIIDVTVDWMDRYANRPVFIIQFDRVVDRKQMLFDRRGHLLLGVDGEAACFYSYTDNVRDGGYGNSPYNFTIRDPDGSISKLSNVGCWSSRSGCINREFEQQVTGHNAIVATIEGLTRWIKDNPECGFGVAKVSRFGDEIYYEPTNHKSGALLKPGDDVELLEIIV